MMNKRSQIKAKIVLNVLGSICYLGASGSAILQQLNISGGLIILGSIFIFIGNQL